MEDLEVKLKELSTKVINEIMAEIESQNLNMNGLQKDMFTSAIFFGTNAARKLILEYDKLKSNY